MAKTLRDMVDEALKTIREVSPEEAQELIDQGWLLLDVREPKEFASGHLEHAINIPRGFLEVRADLEHPGHDARLADRGRKVLCYSGNGGFRSVLAAKVLREMGFADAVSLKGGYLSWKAKGLSCVTPYDPVP